MSPEQAIAVFGLVLVVFVGGIFALGKPNSRKSRTPPASRVDRRSHARRRKRRH